MDYLFLNARVCTPYELTGGAVLVRDGVIEGVFDHIDPPEGARVIDAGGRVLAPGYIDLHVHGGGGTDFQEGTEEAFRTAVAAHAKYGTTSIFPTLSSSTVPMIEKAVQTCNKLMKEKDSPIMGLHLEGHYLNPNKAGAQQPDWLKNPDPNEYIPIVEHSDCLARWDAAPELPGALQFGKYCSEKGVLPSIAHTNAEYSDVRSAFEVGFTHVTHFYNAMPGFHNKQGYKYEGTVESVYLIDDMTIECVADGIHVPPTILRMAYKVKGVERMALITDALAPAAAPKDAKAYDSRVYVEDGVCKLTGSGALAGSCATSDRLIRTMVQQADVPLEDAVKMITDTPAHIMGIQGRKGTLSRGKDADIVVLDEKLRVRCVWQMGKIIENSLFK